MVYLVESSPLSTSFLQMMLPEQVSIWLMSHHTTNKIAQLARAVEYTDCTSAEG